MDIATIAPVASARESLAFAPVAQLPYPSPAAPAAPAADPLRGARLPEPSTPDMPAAVGWLIVASYAAILIAFAWVFAGASDVQFNLGVCAVYLAMYLGVPWAFLKGERLPHGLRRPDLADFMEKGLSTWTGHVTGAEALAQMLTIPVALVFAALGIGVILRLSA